MKDTLFLALIALAALSGYSSVKETNPILTHPIQASYIGIFRDGGTVQLQLNGRKEGTLKVFIDRRIGIHESNTELYNALWINAYPGELESKRISYGTPKALEVKEALGQALSNYTKEQRADWSISKQNILKAAYHTIN